MPARLMRQNPSVQEEFRKRIQAKVELEKEAMKKRVDEEVPSFVAWALKPIFGIVFDIQRDKYDHKGDECELDVGLRLRLVLSKEWILINDVVLEPRPDEFCQTDHIVIGPPGVFVIETKAWEGAFHGHKDRWKRKQGNRWVSCHSPTKQNLRHARLIKEWLTDICRLELPESEGWIKPLVVFTGAQWLKVNECSMPVFNGALELALYIRLQKERCLTPQQIESICHVLCNPLMVKQKEQEKGILSDSSDKGEIQPEIQDTSSTMEPQIETGRTKQGKDFVRISGCIADAENVWEQYRSEGKEPSTLKPDKYRESTWFFYFSEK